MPIKDLNSSQLQNLLTLVKEKEKIQQRIDSINAVLQALETNGSTVSEPKVAGKKHRSKRRKGTPLKNSILQALKASKSKGMKIPALAQSIGAKPGSVSVWIYTNLKLVRKLSPGTFGPKS